jgi:C4-dicarboxylate-specific signal transduction histidine kinase
LQAALDEALEVVEGRMAQAGIEIGRHYSDTPCEVQADPRRIKQVMLNLLENAIEAMAWPENGEKKGGELTLTTRMTEERAIIELQDTGPGIAPDLFDRVFTPFFTTKPSGSGLGLAVSRRIISDHGGQIRVEAPEAGGTRFIIELPRFAVVNNHVPEGVVNGQDSRG